MVDEADDVFTGVDDADAGSRRGSKAFVNRIVERGEAPTIWITNSPDLLGEAVVRRMNIVVEFPKPSPMFRRRIIERIGLGENFPLTEADRDHLARLEVAPALIENGIRVAARLKAGVETAVTVIAATNRAMGEHDLIPSSTADRYDPAWSRADVDLIDLTARIVRSPQRAISFLLAGPPGSGKSAWARHLAERMGLEVMEVRASDVLDCFVGETEANIAGVFRRAAETHAFLLIDEADSLLRSRARAEQSWEVTRVNEMLIWMERHPQPFACTTNALDTLDPATLRRFLFKVNFLALDEAAIDAMFVAHFHAITPRRVRVVTDLTPGDFAVVTRKAAALDEHDPARIADWLVEEARAKGRSRST